MDWMVINNAIIKYELILRMACFGFVLMGLAYWESRATWRQGVLNQRVRWANHMALGGFSTFLVRMSFPVLALTMAVVAEVQHLGLLNTTTFLPFWLKVVLSLIGMDFAMYMEHRWMHRYKILWRVHQVHHSDTELDVSTGLRFHPIEYFFMMGIKLVAILFLGPPVFAVFIFEVMLISFLLFAHSNIQLSPIVEYYLRFIFVTPNMHRIHHSDIPFEHNKNFGFCFSIWDRMLNSYIAQPHQGDHHLVFGLEIYRLPAFQTLLKLLALPFIKYKAVKNRFAHIK